MREKKEVKLAEPLSLPDEIWIRMLEIGIQTTTLTISDISSFSISCKHFFKLSEDDTVWSTLLTLDFPPKHPNRSLQSSSSSLSKKTVYKHRLERYIKRKLAYIRRKFVRHWYRLSRVGKRIRRNRRVITVMTEEIKEFSPEQIDLINDRYSWCLEELGKMERKHMDMENAATLINLEIMAAEEEVYLCNSAVSENTVFEDDEADNKEDFEDSTEDESEESSESESDGISEDESEASSEDEPEANSEGESEEDNHDAGA